MNMSEVKEARDHYIVETWPVGSFPRFSHVRYYESCGWEIRTTDVWGNTLKTDYVAGSKD